MYLMWLFPPAFLPPEINQTRMYSGVLADEEVPIELGAADIDRGPVDDVELPSMGFDIPNPLRPCLSSPVVLSANIEFPIPMIAPSSSPISKLPMQFSRFWDRDWLD